MGFRIKIEFLVRARKNLKNLERKNKANGWDLRGREWAEAFGFIQQVVLLLLFISAQNRVSKLPHCWISTGLVFSIADVVDHDSLKKTSRSGLD